MRVASSEPIKRAVIVSSPSHVTDNRPDQTSPVQSNSVQSSPVGARFQTVIGKEHFEQSMCIWPESRHLIWSLARHGQLSKVAIVFAAMAMAMALAMARRHGKPRAEHESAPPIKGQPYEIRGLKICRSHAQQLDVISSISLQVSEVTRPAAGK